MSKRNMGHPKTLPANAKFADLESRVIVLEGCERRAGEYRVALMNVRRAKETLRAAERAMEKAADAFLGVYQPLSVRFENPTSGTS